MCFAGKPLIINASVEEYLNPDNSISERFYNLKHIKIIPLERTGLAKNSYA
ncbi:hypothetical protein AGMMS49975_27990 [Clostridia bacterium]|nr:hypothetical protein AGMMS49975_27990 [Clostridia bacterium]